MATYVKTVDPNGSADYTSISNWEAGEQSAYTSGDIAIADCRRTGPAKDTTAVVVAGWTTGVVPKIIVNAAHRHDGTVAGGGYELSPTTNVTFLVISTPNTVIDGLKMRGSTAQSYKSAIAGTSGQTNGVVICNCLIYDYGKTTNDWNDAIYLSGGANTFGGGRCYNNIIIARSGLSARGRGGIACETPYSEGSVYNNTVYGFLGTGNYGIKVQGDSGHILGICKNNVSLNNAIDFIATYARDCDCNVSSDATAPGSTVATGKTAYTDYFVDPVNGDFHLKNTSANLWGISGADLSGTFTTDIDGQTRSAPWDIGADQYTAGGSTYTETLTSTVASVASVDARQTYLEAASVLIQSGVSVAAVQIMLETIITVAGSTAAVTDVAQMVEQCLTTVQSASSVTDAVAYVETLLTTIQGTANASDIQQAVETVQTDIQSAATVADVAQLVESLLTTIQGTATATDTLIGGGQTFAETVLVTATSAAEAHAAQSYVEGVTAVAQGIGTATELQLYLDALTATGQAIATVTDRQLYYDNVAIMAVSGASVVEIGAYIEQVQAAATGVGSVVDVIQGAFVGRYIFVDRLPARNLTDRLPARSFIDTPRGRA